MTDEELKLQLLEGVKQLKIAIMKYDIIFYECLTITQFKEIVECWGELKSIDEVYSKTGNTADLVLLFTAFKDKLQRIENKLFSEVKREF